MADNSKRLKKELADKIKSCLHWRKVNHVTSYFIYLGSVLASITATIGVANEDLFKLLNVELSFIAATPAGALLLNNVLKFQDKSKCYDQFYVSLAALERRLLEQGATVETVSKELTVLDKKMQKTYPQFDSSQIPQK